MSISGSDGLVLTKQKSALLMDVRVSLHTQISHWILQRLCMLKATQQWLSLSFRLEQHTQNIKSLP